MSRFLIVSVALASLFTLPIAAQESYVDWDTFNPSDATFTFDSLTGTVTISNPVNINASFLGIGPVDGATNYPDNWFSPMAPPVATEWLTTSMDNVSGGSVGTVDWTIAFSGPVTDPKIHFVNPDNATIDFTQTTTTGGGPVAVTRLSGNPEFEVTATVVNSTPAAALNAGCEDAMGGNPNGACGTVQLTGTYTTIILNLVDTDTAPGSGDGFVWTISADGPVPVELMSFSIE